MARSTGFIKEQLDSVMRVKSTVDVLQETLVSTERFGYVDSLYERLAMDFIKADLRERILLAHQQHIPAETIGFYLDIPTEEVEISIAMAINPILATQVY